jgi:hypothetical protein
MILPFHHGAFKEIRGFDVAAYRDVSERMDRSLPGHLSSAGLSNHGHSQYVSFAQPEGP